MGKIYVVGIGPGKSDMMTVQAKEALNSSDVIVGYKTYIDLVRDEYSEKEFYENGMRGEIERCEKCVTYAKEGKTVALICSGDAGVYGMASPLLEVAEREGFSDVEILDYEDLEDDNYTIDKPVLVHNGDKFLEYLLDRYYGLNIVGFSATQED